MTEFAWPCMNSSSCYSGAAVAFHAQSLLRAHVQSEDKRQIRLDICFVTAGGTPTPQEATQAQNHGSCASINGGGIENGPLRHLPSPFEGRNFCHVCCMSLRAFSTTDQIKSEKLDDFCFLLFEVQKECTRLRVPQFRSFISYKNKP